MAHKPRRFDLSPDNFIAGVSGVLTADELGVYWALCLLVYSEGGPIVYDEMRLKAFLRNTHLKTIRAAVVRLETLSKITLNGSELMVKGCLNPIESAVNRVSKAIENGSKGGRPSNNNNSLGKPDGSFDEKLTTTSNNQPPPPSIESSLRSDVIKAKRAFQIPEGFPTVEAMASAVRYWDGKSRRDLSEQCREIAEQFRDHHTSRGTVFKDWEAAWRNWFRNAVKFEKGPQNGRKRTAHDSFAAAAATIASDFSGRDFAEGSDDFRDVGEIGTALLPT